jgi:flavodoxin
VIGMKKALVAYYSHSGTTRKAAEEIHQIVGGDLFEIKEATPYPRDYNTVLKQAKQEIDNGFRPALMDKIPEISDYDLIILGSPNWWSTIAPPVATFLTQADFSGQTIAPFITHGGKGLSRTIIDIRKLSPDANILEGFDANRSGQFSAWLKSLHIKDE